MKLDLNFVQLSNNDTFFASGTNFGNKLYTVNGSKGPLTMWYDTEAEKIFVICKNKVQMVNSWTNAELMTPAQAGIALSVAPEVTKLTHHHHAIQAGVAAKAQIGGPMSPFERPSAQVETPMDKVQGKPGRKPKFQGEESST